ncbi:MAG: ABC transporter substrate-binding protein [Hyphomicrobiaceae bacterium]
MNAANLFLAGFLSVCLFASGAVDSSAKPFVWARAGDALTLDPHAVNEGSTHALNHQIYEPLIIRDHAGKLEPALATSWTQTIDPKIWSFQLRSQVTFHDGKPLTADDVVFSIERALSIHSDMRTRLQSVRSVKAVAANEIEIKTHVPDPLLPIRLTDIFIMNKAWAEAHGALEPQKYLAGEKTFASTNSNGTGPYKLVSRTPGKETKLTRNQKYWGWRETDASSRVPEIIYRPMPTSKDRITALLDGSVDFVQDVPLSELEVLRQAPNLKLSVGPENRVIFIGLSVKAQFDGKPNPLANKAVREAIGSAIDRLSIQRNVMLGQSIPTAVLAPPGINGFPFELDEIPPRDTGKVRSLLKKANVAEGTKLTLDCPNNRYVNDAAICKAVAAQLATVGLNVEVVLRPKRDHFRKVRSGQSQFFLLGWGVPTFDSAYIFSNLFHTRQNNLGTWNGTGFSDPDLDKQIMALSQLNESGARARSMSYIWQTAREARIYIPIHVQTLMYAMRNGIDVTVDISNTPKLKHAKIVSQTADTHSQ